jgi:sodium transport system permease protein
MPTRTALRAFRAILASELLLLLRDRRAILLAVVLPTVLYPMLFLGQRWLQRTSNRALEERRVRVACDVRALEGSQRLIDLLGEQLTIDIEEVDSGELALPSHGKTPADTAENDAEKLAEARAAVARLAGGPGGVLLVARGTDGDPPVSLRLYFDGTNDESTQARRRVDRAIDRFQQERRAEIVERRIGFDPAAGLSTTFFDVARPEDAAGSRLGKILPLLAVIVLLSGGSYAALSTFAGEREAGTL